MFHEMYFYKIMDTIYREQILQHYKYPHNSNQLVDPQHTSCLENPTCGDKICVDINFDSAGTVKEVGFYGQGCAISQASASMLSDKILEEKMTREQIKALIKDDILILIGIELSPVRLKCALLGLDALKGAIEREKIEDR